MDPVKADFSGLEKLLKELNAPYVTKIGVFKDAVTPDGEQIASYGADNEFGVKTKKIPERSFIRMPLEAKQDDIKKAVYRRAGYNLENANVRQIFEDIGFAGEAAIQEAFDTRGFGKWPENAEQTIELKKSDAPLIDKGHLRHAITSKVEPGAK